MRLEDTRAVLGAMDASLFGRLTGSLLSGDVGATWRQLDELLEQGRDPREVARALGHHFRDLLLARLAGTRGEATGPLADDPTLIARQAESVSEKILYEAIDLFSSADAELRLANQPRLVLEARLVKLCSSMPQIARPQPAPSADELHQAVVTPASRPEPARPRRKGRGGQADTPPQAQAPPRDAETIPPPQLEPPPPVEPQTPLDPQPEAPGTPAGVTPVTPGLLQRAWQGALAQLPDTSSGYLAAASPEWDGRRVCVWLPEGMDWMAEYLGGKDTCRRLADAMAPTIGATVPVVIQVRSRRSLFVSPDEGNGERRRVKSPAPPASAGRSAPGPAQGPPAVGAPAKPGSAGTDAGGDDDLREAQLMFRAEEVSKGED